MYISCGKWFGVPLLVHASVFLFLLLIMLLEGILPALFYFLSLLSVVPHEYGHVLASKRFGIECEHVCLYPIGGVALMRSFTYSPVRELAVALAGPLVTLVLFGVSLLLALWLNWLVFWGLAIVNAGIFLFNMLPIAPLDGFRAFRSVLGFFFSWGRATLAAVRVGQILAISLSFILLYSGRIWSPLVLFLLVYLGERELRNGHKVGSANGWL